MDGGDEGKKIKNISPPLGFAFPFQPHTLPRHSRSTMVITSRCQFSGCTAAVRSPRLPACPARRMGAVSQPRALSSSSSSLHAGCTDGSRKTGRPLRVVKVLANADPNRNRTGRRRGSKLAEAPPPPTDDKKPFLVIGALFIILPVLLLLVGSLTGEVTVGTGSYAPS